MQANNELPDWKEIFPLGEQLKRALLPLLIAALAIIPAVTILVSFHIALWLWSLFVVGLSIGGMLTYKQGMNDKERIIVSIYGKEWERNAIIGQRLIDQAHYKEHYTRKGGSTTA